MSPSVDSVQRRSPLLYPTNSNSGLSWGEAFIALACIQLALLSEGVVLINRSEIIWKLYLILTTF